MTPTTPDPTRTFAMEAGPGVPGVFSTILRTRIQERCPAREGAANPAVRIRFEIDPSLKDQSFRIEETKPGEIRIASDQQLGLLAGAGKFLRTSTYSDRGFTPSPWRGTSTPRAALRGMTTVTHFFNWYHVAPEEELERYLEDLALWGVSHILIGFPVVNLFGWDDPEVDAFFTRARRFSRACSRLSMTLGMGWPLNQDFKHPRPEFRAVPNRDELGRKGNHGNNMCPSLPGALEYMDGFQDEFFRRLGDTRIGMFMFWPYDEGGCGCEACFPWGANGYLRVCRRAAARIRARLPGVDLVLGTWVFDTPPAGEWEGLARDLDAHGNFVDYILADSHEDFPRYPLDMGVPGGLPLINFPEISMWGLYPWGGFGATVLPARFQRLWNQVKHVVRGGLPYSDTGGSQQRAAAAQGIVRQMSSRSPAVPSGATTSAGARAGNAPSAGRSGRRGLKRPRGLLLEPCGCQPGLLFERGKMPGVEDDPRSPRLRRLPTHPRIIRRHANRVLF